MTGQSGIVFKGGSLTQLCVVAGDPGLDIAAIHAAANPQTLRVMAGRNGPSARGNQR